MANPSTQPRGNISGNWILAVALTPAAVGATTTSEQTFTVSGVLPGDFIDISKPSHQPGIALGNVRVSAANTIAVEFANNSTGTLTPTAGEIYSIGVTRPENVAAQTVTGTTSANVSILTQIQ